MKNTFPASILWAWLAASSAWAHLSGRLGVDHYILIEAGPAGLEVMADLHLGVMPTRAVGVRLDTNRNGRLEPEEYRDYVIQSGQVYAGQLKAVCVLGGTSHVVPLSLAPRDRADAALAHVAQDEEGEDTLRMRWRFQAEWPEAIASGGAPFDLYLRLLRSPSDRFVCQMATGMLTPPVTLVSSSIPNSMELPLPPDNAPPVPDEDIVMVTTGRMRLSWGGAESREAPPPPPESSEPRLSGYRKSSAGEGRLKGWVHSLFGPDMSPGAQALAALLCLVWGALHAMSPGHGKTIVSAYLIGARATYTQATLLGLLVTLTHTAVVLVLAVAAVILKERFVFPAWLQPLSAVIILLLGLNLFRKALVSGLSGAHDGSAHDLEHHHGPGGHTHVPSGDIGSLNAREIMVAGLSGGMVPCPAAIILLLFSWQLGRPTLGLICLLTFSVGLAGTLMSVGFLAIAGVRRIVKWTLKTETEHPHHILPAVMSGIGGLVLAAYGVWMLLAF